MYISSVSNYGIINAMKTNQTAIAKSTQRLSTGQKLRSDSPVDIGISRRLESSIRLGEAQQRINEDAISFVQFASAGLDHVSELLTKLKDLSSHYGRETLSATDKQAIVDSAKELGSELSSVIKNLNFNGKSVFKVGKLNFNTGEGKINIDLNDLNNIAKQYSPTVSQLVTTNTAMMPVGKGEGYYAIPDANVVLPDQEGYSGFKRVVDDKGSLIYEGHLTNGIADGYGKYYENGKIVYEGEYVKGVYDDFGTIYGDNGKVVYQGDIKDGKAHGWGTYYGMNGMTLYQGGFKEGYRDGWGTTYDINGNLKESKMYSDYNNRPSETTPPQTGGNGGSGNDSGNTTVPNLPGIDLGDLDTLDPDDLLNGELLDKLQEGLDEAKNKLGISEYILERRISFQAELNRIQEGMKERIQSVDVAKELTQKAKHEMLLQMNTYLFTRNIERQRSMMTTLLSAL